MPPLESASVLLAAPERAAREEIAIQAHGIVLGVTRSTLTIDSVSDNVETLLNREPWGLIGRPLGTLVAADGRDACVAWLRGVRDAALAPGELLLIHADGARLHVDGAAHVADGDRLIVEFEPRSGPPAPRDLAAAQGPIARIAAAEDVPALLTAVARDMQLVSGFSRVTIVRVGPDGNEAVAAQALGTDADDQRAAAAPPAAAGSAQRRLRLIVDGAARPSALAGASIDLARTVLRAPSAAERGEIAAANSRALLRIPVWVRGRPWGRIDCRDAVPRHLDRRKRAICELIGRMLAWRLGALIGKETMQEQAGSAAVEAQLDALLERAAADPAAALVGAEILALFDADAGVVRIDGVLRRSPGAPGDDGFVLALAAKLEARAVGDVAWSERPADLGVGRLPVDAPAGALYLRLSADGSDFAVVLRARRIRSVSWDAYEPPTARPDRSWTADDIGAARVLCERVRARLQHRARQLTHVDRYLDARNVQTAALLQLHADVAAAMPSRSAIVGVVLDFVQRQTGADGSVMETLTATEIVCEAANGLLAPFAGKRIPRAGSLSGSCVDLNAALLCDDSNGEVEPLEGDWCRPIGAASMVVVPITATGGVTTVLKVVSARRSAFTDDDIQTLKLAATNLSTALRAAQEFAALAVAEREQRTYAQQLRALHAIATTTTGKRKDQIDAALRLGLEQLGLDWGFLGVIDEAEQMLIIENSVGADGPPLAATGTRMPLSHSLVRRSASNGVLIVADVNELEQPPYLGGWGSLIGAPLVIEGVIYGVIGFTSRGMRAQPFSEANVEFVALAGELIASAVERSRQREALITSERRYRALTEAIPEMVWVVDAAHRFVYVNARWTAYTGLTLEQSRALGSAAVYDAAAIALVDDKRSVIPPAEYRCEVRLRRHDGVYRWHLMRGVPFHDSASEWLVTATDIEDRKSAEALMTGVHEAALAATEAKSRFLATMSHEIRTPMNAVIGMTELLLLTQLSEEQREYLEIVRNSGQSLLRVLNDILDYSKIEAGKLELETVHFDLPGQIESVVELLRAQYQIKGVRLTTRIKRDVPAVVAGDPGRLRQILLNLVGNALKFTPEGGDVHIDVGALPTAGDAVPIRFSVEDTGIGIPPDIVERLFQPFSQGDESTTRKYGGTGLGLSICAQLVALMNGTIGVESLPGAGSTFSFTIPLRPAKPSAKGPDARKRGSAARSKPVVMRAEKILLVEDNEINTFLALKQLQRIGFIVSAVNNGRQAVEAVARERFDLVFMDCHMPEMDGFAATREIRRIEQEARSARRLPIVAITADARTEDHQNCLRAGMDDYVSKPTSLESLRAVLDRWLPSPDRRQNSRNGSTRTNPPATLRVAKLLEIFGGDRGAVITLLTAAAGAIKADFARIENCTATREYGAVAEAAHRLKGTSASIRSPRLGEISVAVERAALSAKVSDALLHELREAVETLVADVEKHGRLLATIG